jgi:formate dehydrogenase maturation protein FdhE
MNMPTNTLNPDALLAWTVWLKCVIPDGIDEDGNLVSEGQQIKKAVPQLSKYSDQELDNFVSEVFAYEGPENPHNYIWSPPPGFRAANRPCDRDVLAWSKAHLPACPVCGRPTCAPHRTVKCTGCGTELACKLLATN